MAIKGPNPDNIVKMLLIGVIFLGLITSIIDFSAIQSDDPNAKVFKEDLNYNSIAAPFFKWLIAGMAAWFAYSLTLGAQGRLDRKKLVTIVVLGFALFFIYQNFLVNLIPGLEPIQFAAYQLQSVVGMGP